MDEAAARWVHVDTLHPWDRNPRHNEQAAEQVAGAMREYGFTAPIVVQAGSNRILAGHTRQKAVHIILKQEPDWTAPGAPGPGMVPARFVDVDDATATRITIADNRLGDLAVWDEAQLSKLLQDMGPDDLRWMGFDQDELSALLGTWEDPFADQGDTFEPSADDVQDDGVAKIVVVLAITSAQDAAQAIRAALEGMGVKPSKYTMKVV